MVAVAEAGRRWPARGCCSRRRCSYCSWRACRGTDARAARARRPPTRASSRRTCGSTRTQWKPTSTAGRHTTPPRLWLHTNDVSPRAAHRRTRHDVNLLLRVHQSILRATTNTQWKPTTTATSQYYDLQQTHNGNLLLRPSVNTTSYNKHTMETYYYGHQSILRATTNTQWKPTTAAITRGSTRTNCRRHELDNRRAPAQY